MFLIANRVFLDALQNAVSEIDKQSKAIQTAKFKNRKNKKCLSD